MELLPDFDKNAAYIWACYLVAGFGVLAMCLMVLITARRAQKTLKQLESSHADDTVSKP